MRIVYISLIAAIGLLLIPVGLVFSFTRAFFILEWNPIPKVVSYISSLGVALSQLLNTTCSDLFNDALITHDGFKFGNPEHTTSSVLGMNYKEGSLKPLGYRFVWVLDQVDPDHCLKALESELICKCKKQ